MKRIGGARGGRGSSPPRRRNPAAKAVRSPAFRPKVFRDHRAYDRRRMKANDHMRSEDEDDEVG